MWKRRIFLFMQGHLEKKSFCLRKKLAFSAHAKPTNKEKPFFSTAKFQFPTAPKLTCSHKFHLWKPTVSLQQNNPFSKLRNLASDVWPPFRTDSNPHRRYPERLQFPAQPVTWWKPVTLEKAMYRAEIWIEVAGRSRLLETWSPCSRPFAILPVSAVSDAQKLATGNFLHVRARAFWLLFAQRKKWQFVLFAENIEVLQTSIQLAAVAASHKQN